MHVPSELLSTVLLSGSNRHVCILTMIQTSATTTSTSLVEVHNMAVFEASDCSKEVMAIAATSAHCTHRCI